MTPKKKGAAHGMPERPKSREETPKEGSGTAASNAAPHQYAPVPPLSQDWHVLIY
jgi:hypothetical protein